MIVLILIAVICAPLLIVAAFNQQPPPKAPLSDFDLVAARKKARLMVYGARGIPSEMFVPQRTSQEFRRLKEGWGNFPSYTTYSAPFKHHVHPLSDGISDELIPRINAEIGKSIEAITDSLFIGGDGGAASPDTLQAVAQPEQITSEQFIDHIKACVARLRERDPLRGIPKDYVCVIHPRWIPELKRIGKLNPDVAPFPLLPRRFDRLFGRQVISQARAPQDKFEFMSMAEYYRRYPVIPIIEAPEFGPSEWPFVCGNCSNISEMHCSLWENVGFVEDEPEKFGCADFSASE